MVTLVKLPLKEFKVDAAKIHNRIFSLIGEALDGVGISEECVEVTVKGVMTQPQDYAIGVFWRDLTEASYNTPTAQEQMAILAKMYDDARVFGKSLIVQFALENIATGITQAGKTRIVADYCMKIQYYMDSGSLYAALEEVQAMIADTSGRVNMQPWLSDEKLTIYKNKLKTYLHIT